MMDVRKHARRNEAGDPMLSPALETLKKSIARWSKNEGPNPTAIAGLMAVRYDAPTKPRPAMYEPSVCVSAQGAKRVLLGGESFTYAPGNFLIASVQLPTTAQIVHATAEKPFLGCVLMLDPREISQLMVDGSLPPPRAQRADRAMACGTMTPPLLAAFQRLVDLLSEPKDLPILAPVLRREITYRLLVSDQGARLRQVALAGSRGHQITQAIAWLREKFAEPLRVEDLAERVHMSPSAFHHHFRLMTAMSPLQYQKWLRLSEARRLMLAENMNAGTAALEVGYESPSQFSREYRRLFEKPPLQDITQLRRTTAIATV
jgi:AraC-like DNA-binding protein